MMDNLATENTEGPKAPSTLAPTFPHAVATWPRNSRETIQVKLDRYQGRETIDVRTWYPGDGDELKPGKGLTLGIAHLPKLAAAINAALQHAIAMGLLQEGGVK